MLRGCIRDTTAGCSWILKDTEETTGCQGNSTLLGEQLRGDEEEVRIF